MGLGEFRARHQDHPVVTQLADGEVGLVVESGSHADCHIDALLDEIDLAVDAFEFDPDAGVGLHEGGEDAGQHIVGEAGRTGDPQRTMGLRFGAGDQGFRLLGADDHRLAMAIELTAQIGHLEFASRAFEEPDAQPALEPRHMLRELGLGHIEGPGGGRKPPWFTTLAKK